MRRTKVPVWQNNVAKDPIFMQDDPGLLQDIRFRKGQAGTTVIQHLEGAINGKVLQDGAGEMDIATFWWIKTDGRKLGKLEETTALAQVVKLEQEEKQNEKIGALLIYPCKGRSESSFFVCPYNSYLMLLKHNKNMSSHLSLQRTDYS